SPIKVPDKPERPARATAQRFFISKDRLTPNPEPLPKSGGLLSFSDDGETQTTSLTVDTVLTYLLLDPARPAPTTGPIGRFGLASYLDLKGTVNSGADDVTSATIGLDALFDLEGGNFFDLQTIR
ncbi:unnamed protein product, partial [Chrysoparadoxa australica]